MKLMHCHRNSVTVTPNRVQFLDIKRGYTSIAMTLRSLRNENERIRRMRKAIQDEDFEDIEDMDDDAGDDDILDIDSIY